MRKLSPFVLALAVVAACGRSDSDHFSTILTPTGLTAVSHGNGLSGSGTSGSPLGVVADSNRLASVTAGGIGLDLSAATTTARVAYDGTRARWVGGTAMSSRMFCERDDLSVRSGQQSGLLQEANATGAGGLAYTAGSDKHPGVATCSTNALATGGCVFGTSVAAYSLSDTDVTCIKWIASVRTLDDGTDTYVWELGAGDTAVPAQNDGFGFISTRTTSVMGSAATAKMQIFTISGGGANHSNATLDGVTTDTVDTTVAVGDMSALTGQINSYLICGNTSRLDFCINDTDDDGVCHAGSTGHVGSACATGCSMPATFIPPSGTTHSWGIQAFFQKQAGTSVSRQEDVDLGEICRPFSAAR